MNFRSRPHDDATPDGAARGGLVLGWMAFAAWRCGLFLGLMTGVSSMAQTVAPVVSPEIQAIETLRNQFHTSVLKESKSLTMLYESALLRIEQQAAESGDFQEAMRIRDRRLALTNLYADLVNGAQENGGAALGIPLGVEKARFSGASVDAEGHFAGWRSSSHFVEWDELRLPGGQYHLQFEYRMAHQTDIPSAERDPADGVYFEFFEVSSLASAEQNRRTFELKHTPRSGTYVTLQNGPITYASSPSRLRLRTVTSHPNLVFQIRNVQLIPSELMADTEALKTDKPVVSGDKLKQLRKNVTDELIASYQAPMLAHEEALKNLQGKHSEWESLIGMELDQYRALVKTSARTQNLPLPRPMGSLGNLSGYQDWENVTYREHESNTGSSFQVEHDGEVHKIRLQWIATAKPSGNSESLPFCSIVDLDKEDADLFGRAAREFTAGYLDGRSFRMLIYSTPDKDGTLPALLFLPGGLLFQQILVEQGLACLLPRPSAQGMNPSGGTIETTLYRNLEAAQAEVMARQPRPGAWAMSRQSKP